MAARRRSRKRSIYSYPRYWYHLSSTLKKSEVHLIPWDEDKGFNRGGYEPKGKRICVSPTIEQCLTAIPYSLNERFVIYRTKDKTKAEEPRNVFDANVTEEGWLHDPTTFVKVGTLAFSDVRCGLGVQDVVEEAGSSGHAPSSGRVLKWWKRAKVARFIKTA